MSILEADSAIDICNGPRMHQAWPRRPTGPQLDQRLAQQCQSLITFFEATAGDRLVAGVYDQTTGREFINHLKKIFRVKGSPSMSTQQQFALEYGGQREMEAKVATIRADARAQYDTAMAQWYAQYGPKDPHWACEQSPDFPGYANDSPELHWLANLYAFEAAETYARSIEDEFYNVQSTNAWLDDLD